ncbi:hypothetical protein BVY01_02355 [bacterium I07]|nr:hypothetical protein BVY01_02355 [bacterium I07]
MKLSDYASGLQAKIDKELVDLFKDKSPRSLYEPMLYPLESGGKRIRPLLVLLCCEAVGGTVEQSIQAALGIEMLHTFTLVHDDIMDRDDSRRGRPTVHVRWDEATAVIAGDGLVTLGYQALLRSHHASTGDLLRVVNNGLLRLCEGQALDKEFETRNDVTIDAYLDMISRKTAQLIEVSCEVGAILGNGSANQCRALKSFARELGMAFQIQDDLLDLMSEEKISGKPMGSDLLQKKKTYLIIHFLSHAKPVLKDEFLDIWSKEALDQTDILAVRDLFKKAGTLEAARNDVENRLEKAMNSLQVLPESRANEDLRALVKRLQNRNA